MTATVRIERVSHRFGAFEALKGIDLSIEAGRFAVLLGPSGCGKTTLLSVLGGFISPSGGRVLLDGEDVTHLAPAKRPTTTMFQDYALFPHMTLVDNVGFGPRMRGARRGVRHAKAAEMLALVGLEHEGGRKPHELSGGQRQRAALARALAVDPEVLLLDEPLGALDLNLRRQMQDELKAIQRRVGTTFVHVTHDQEEAMAIADDIIVMNAGRIEDTGSPEAIYLRPKTLFAAGFMGEANLVEGHVDSIDNAIAGPLLRTNSRLGDVVLPASAATGHHALTAGESVGICFRPEHIVLADGHAADDVVSLGRATILDHAFFGAHQRCRLTVDDGATTLLAHLSPTTALIDGQSLDIAVPRRSIVLLTRERA